MGLRAGVQLVGLGLGLGRLKVVGFKQVTTGVVLNQGGRGGGHVSVRELASGSLVAVGPNWVGKPNCNWGNTCLVGKSRV